MEALIGELAIVLSIALYIAHRYGPDWDFLFGAAFFAGIPAIAEGLAGYVVGLSFLLFFTLLTYLMERLLSGEWQEPQV